MMIVRLKRKDLLTGDFYFEEFQISGRNILTGLDLLKVLSQQTVNARGEPITPVVYEGHVVDQCHGECGGVVNGKAVLLCRYQLTESGLLTIEPLKKGEVVRDLVTRRSQSLSLPLLSPPVDATLSKAPVFRLVKNDQQKLVVPSSCLSCRLCDEVCDSYDSKKPDGFIGPQNLLKIYLALKHPGNEERRDSILEFLSGPTGVFACDDKGACQTVCPEQIPLVDLIGKLRKIAWKDSWKTVFG